MQKMDQEVCKSLSELMTREVKNVILIAHINPDGDALGSSFGLSAVLNEAGFNAVVILPNEYPSILGHLPQKCVFKNFEHQENDSIQLIENADLIFLLDFNDLKRIGKIGKLIEKLNKNLVLIDHHPFPSIEANFTFSTTTVSSTSELVYEFIRTIGWTRYIDKFSANALLTGILADTASFSHNASQPDLYRIVADLIELGAQPSRIQDMLFNNFSDSRLRLMGYASSTKMEILPEFHTALISLSKEELKSYNYQTGDTEGLVNYPLSIKGIIFSVLFMENEEKIRISFRSKGKFPVNEVSSAHFSGGGHHNAAGGESRISLTETIDKFKKILPEYSEMLNLEANSLYSPE